MRTSPVLLLASLLPVGGSMTVSSEAFAAEPEKTPAAKAENKTLERGRELTALFYKGETGRVWSRMTTEMRKALGSEEKLAAFRQQVGGQLGVETKTIDEKTSISGPYQVYLRTASFSKFDKAVAVQWSFDAEGNVAGFFIKPAQ